MNKCPGDSGSHSLTSKPRPAAGECGNPGGCPLEEKMDKTWAEGQSLVQKARVLDRGGPVHREQVRRMVKATIWGARG